MTDAIARPAERTARLSPRCSLRLILPAVLPAALFCAPPAVGETLWDNDGEYVETAAHDGRANDHPFRISPELLADALAKLRVAPAKRARETLGEEDETAPTPLFTRATAQRLARFLAEGFRQTGPGEDLAFRTIDSAPLFGKAIHKQVFTAARVFWRDRRLNLIFGGIHKNVKKRWLYGQAKGWVNPPEPGDRGEATPLKFRVVEAPGVRNLRTRDGRKRLDWVIIEPRTLAEAEIEAGAETGTTGKAEAGRRKPAGSPRTSPRASPRARLRRLEELRDDDLISEQEYRRKRTRILEEL